MRVPVDLVGKTKVPILEKFLGERLRKVGIGKTEQLVFRKDQWERFTRLAESEMSSMCEASAVVLRAYSMLMKNYPAAKRSPEGRMAIISAVMSIYSADPGVGSRLQFALNL